MTSGLFKATVMRNFSLAKQSMTNPNTDFSKSLNRAKNSIKWLYQDNSLFFLFLFCCFFKLGLSVEKAFHRDLSHIILSQLTINHKLIVFLLNVEPHEIFILFILLQEKLRGSMRGNENILFWFLFEHYKMIAYLHNILNLLTPLCLVWSTC